MKFIYVMVGLGLLFNNTLAYGSDGQGIVDLKAKAEAKEEANKPTKESLAAYRRSRGATIGLLAAGGGLMAVGAGVAYFNFIFGLSGDANPTAYYVAGGLAGAGAILLTAGIINSKKTKSLKPVANLNDRTEFRLVDFGYTNVQGANGAFIKFTF